MWYHPPIFQGQITSIRDFQLIIPIFLNKKWHYPQYFRDNHLQTNLQAIYFSSNYFDFMLLFEFKFENTWPWLNVLVTLALKQKACLIGRIWL